MGILCVFCVYDTIGNRCFEKTLFPKTNIISFWMNIVNGKQTKLSKWLYLLLLGEYDGGIHQHKWIHFIKHILISVGRPDLLNKEVIENQKSIKKSNL